MYAIFVLVFTCSSAVERWRVLLCVKICKEWRPSATKGGARDQRSPDKIIICTKRPYNIIRSCQKQKFLNCILLVYHNCKSASSSRTRIVVFRGYWEIDIHRHPLFHASIPMMISPYFTLLSLTTDKPTLVAWPSFPTISVRCSLSIAASIPFLCITSLSLRLTFCFDSQDRS